MKKGKKGFLRNAYARSSITSSPGPDLRLRTFPRLDPFRRFLFPPRSPRASRARLPAAPPRAPRLEVAPVAESAARARVLELGNFSSFSRAPEGSPASESESDSDARLSDSVSEASSLEGFSDSSFLSPRARLSAARISTGPPQSRPTPAGGARTSSGARTEARRAPSPTTREGPASRRRSTCARVLVLFRLYTALRASEPRAQKPEVRAAPPRPERGVHDDRVRAERETTTSENHDSSPRPCPFVRLPSGGTTSCRVARARIPRVDAPDLLARHAPP